MKLRLILIAVAILATGCAMPQYRSRLVPFAGSTPPMSSEQVMAICNSQASNASQAAKAGAQAQVDSRNNQVTGYNCSTYGQSNAYGGSATYNGNTNCSPTTSSPYGGKYGGVAAASDGLGVVAAGVDAGRNAFRACAAERGYRVDRTCVANCKT